MGIIAQQPSGFGNVRVAVLNVTGAVRAKDWLDLHMQRFGQAIINVNQIFPAAVGNVVSLASCLCRGKAGLQVGFDHIFNVGKVPALPAVAVDGGALTAEQLFDEFGYHRGVGSIGVLAAAKDIEIPKADGFQAIMAGILSGPLLVAPFGQGVGGEQVSLRSLSLG